MNVYKELNRLKVQLRTLLVLELCTLVECLVIIFILSFHRESNVRKNNSSELFLTKPTMVRPASLAVLPRCENTKVALSLKAKKQEKNLADIPEIRSPIGMFVVRSPVVPGSVPSFSDLGVSALTKGAIVSKFLGYLYSIGRLEVIESDYLFPPGCFHKGFIRIPGQYCSKARPLPIAERYSPTKLGRKETSKQCDEGSARCPQQCRKPVIPCVAPGAGQCVANLMMTSPPQGILVASKQADEALRQGRNTESVNERV